MFLFEMFRKTTPFFMRLALTIVGVHALRSVDHTRVCSTLVLSGFQQEI